MAIQCLCHTCTCGKHHCSQKAHKGPCVQVPACRLMEYQEKFPEHPTTAAIQSTKQHTQEYQEGRIANVTTFRSDYVTHELMEKPPKVLKPCVPPEGHMKCTSTYTQDYPIHAVEKHIVTKTENYCPPTTKMISQSVYKDDFRARNAHKLQPYRLCDNLKVDKGQFAETTTCKDAYCRKSPVNVRENCKPAPQIQKVLPFDGTTNYRSRYVIHPVQPRKPKEKPIYQPNSAPLTRVFTSHQDYKGLPTEAAKSFKPKVSWERDQAGFEGTSEFRDKFKIWPLGPKFHHKAEKYNPPEGHMMFLSTAHADYVPHKGQQPESARPAVRAWVKDKEPLQARSTIKEDYKTWGTVRLTPIIPKPELERPKGTIEKHTTSRLAYTPKTVQRTTSCKATQKPLSSKVSWERDQAGFEGTSEFRDKFKIWPLRPKFHHKAEKYNPPEGHMMFLSTAHADYVPHKGQRPESARPPVRAWVKDKEPLQAKSTIKEDYKAWGTVRLTPIIPKPELERPKGTIEKHTTSQLAYTPKTVQRTTSCKATQKPLSSKVSWERDQAGFEGTSEFCDKFKIWPLGPKFHHKAEKYNPPEGHMMFLSTAHADYVPHKGQRPESARPPVRAWVKDKEPLQAKSTIKEDYKAWGTVRLTPIIPKPELERPKGTIEKHTTSRLAYTPKTVQRTTSCKPTQKPLSSKVSWERDQAGFEGTSEFHDKFKIWPLRPKFHHKAEKYNPPEGHMMFLSTAHADYVPHKGQRPESARPPVRAWVKDKEPLQAKSTMKEDYKAWGTVKLAPIIPKPELERPKGTIEKHTTSRLAYTPKTVQRTTSCKPTQKPLSPKPMLEEVSIYHSSYTAKEIPLCPAQNNALPGFECCSKGATGHRLVSCKKTTPVGIPAEPRGHPKGQTIDKPHLKECYMF